MTKKNIKDLSISELESLMSELGIPSYRVAQMLKWLYQGCVRSFDEMTNFKKELRDTFRAGYCLSAPVLVAKETSEDGCVKYLLKLSDGNCIESVIIPDKGRNTLCVSSQVGCTMACRFCLTAKQGFVRNLTVGEILDQVIYTKEQLAPGRITNIVFMGMGEPLLNLDNLLSAIKILSADDAFGFSVRRITVSTCGIVPKLIELCEKTDVAVAVSLNAADDDTRRKIMPVNNKYPVAKLIEACKRLPLKKRARVTFEYVMIAGLNDSISDAKKLTKLLAGMRCKINLIPFNEHPDLGLKTPSNKVIREFQQYLVDKNYTAILRSSRGVDISAACGQLKGRIVKP